MPTPRNWATSSKRDEATLLVIGESRLEEELDKILTRAEKTIEKEIDVDSKEFKRELDKAEKEYATA